MKVTGVMVQYYVACKRELWFFANQINMNYDNEDIQLGRLLHEKTFSREKKSINLGEISIDFMNKKNLTIFEIKKSSSLEEPVRYQLYYYLWYIRKFTGKNVKGVLVYPTEKKREELHLTPELESEIEKIVESIKNVVKMKYPPKPVSKRYCRRCSYYEFCMI